MISRSASPPALAPRPSILVLAVLHDIARTDRYDLIIWFSARDIDLTVAGPKVVQPRVLAEREIAEEYRTLVGGDADGIKEKVSAIEVMANQMRSSPHGTTLFVFDNFETVRNPVDLFQWIDTNIRLPNKAVITSRFREFKADLPIEISGMETAEANSLVDQTVAQCGISNLIGRKEREEIIEESDGYPYVIKIMLGEISSTGKFQKPTKLIARKEDILDALFDRTYANLSPMATRVFLTLSGWRSLVPQLAVEAVLLRHRSGGGDPERAIDELIRMSLIERTRAEDNNDFLGVPLTAAIFGARKLEVSPQRELIENDIRFLQDIGATTVTGLKDVIRPRMESFFRKAARRITDGSVSLAEMRPVLEFVARSYSAAWLLLADLHLEVEGAAGLEASADCVRHFIEQKPSPAEAQAAWQRLTAHYRSMNNIIGGCSAFLKAAELSEPPLEQISSMANALNNEREVIERMDIVERGVLFRPMARLMEKHLDEATATDLSRLAWLYLHTGDGQRALEMAELGLKREPDNMHCWRLYEKLRN